MKVRLVAAQVALTIGFALQVLAQANKVRIDMRKLMMAALFALPMRTLSRPLAGLRAPGDHFQFLAICLLQFQYRLGTSSWHSPMLSPFDRLEMFI